MFNWTSLVVLYYYDLHIDHYYRKLLAAVSHVTIDDLKRVGGLYFKKLFSPSETTTAICCNPNKVQEVKDGLEKLVHIRWLELAMQPQVEWFSDRRTIAK